MRKPQIFWAMVDDTDYIFPHSIRYLRKDVINSLNVDGSWRELKRIGRKIVKIEMSLHVRDEP